MDRVTRKKREAIHRMWLSFKGKVLKNPRWATWAPTDLPLDVPVQEVRIYGPYG